MSEPVASASVASSSSRSNFSSGNISKVEMESQMGVSAVSTCSDVEMERAMHELRNEIL